MRRKATTRLSERFRWLPWVVAIGVWVAAGSGLQAAEETEEGGMRVMTFNLRYASERSPNAWSERRPIMGECIQRVQPDLIGTQEGLYEQLKSLAELIPEYHWIGLGRDGGSHGEFMAIFYRENRFEPLEYDHFWLSDTPEVMGSATWGNSNRRMVTWVRFRDRETGKEFYFVNTHFDHAVERARIKSAQLVRQRVAALETDLPVILAGDFNARAEGSEVYDILVNDEAFTDTWRAAEVRKGEKFDTFNGFRPGPHTGGVRIDWILFQGPVEVESSEIVTFSRDGQYPSDHFPVIAQVRLGED